MCPSIDRAVTQASEERLLDVDIGLAKGISSAIAKLFLKDNSF
jgi:hypothetical protein